MKKILLVIIIGLVGVSAFLLFRPNEKPAAHESPIAAFAPSAPAPQIESAQSAPTQEAPQMPQKDFINGEVMAAVRAAVANGDRAGFEEAFKALVDYINAHPEQVDDYVTVMKSEKDEHVLRTFALALAQTEVGMLANDKIIRASIEMAKDTSFEQRQHIMLNLMSKFPEMRDDVFQTVLELSRQDPNSQVKTSAVTVLADWMDQLPENKAMLLQQVTEIFKTAQDDDVRGFTYQVLALHRENLSREMQLEISERLKTESDSFTGNLLALALSTAPDAVRQGALFHVQNAFNGETDVEKQRNLLAQIVCLSRTDSLPLLQKSSVGESLLAEDSRHYIALLSQPGPFDPELVLQEKAIIDATRAGAHEAHKD